MRASILNLIKVAAIVLLASLSNMASAAVKLPPPSPIYINLEPLEPPDIPPQIDAVIFDNQSSFVVQDAAFVTQNPTFFLLTGFSGQLFSPQSVSFYTNSGSMLGVPGYSFETVIDRRRLTAAQRRKRGALLPKPAAAFVNSGDITVNGLLYVHSTNLVSPGRLQGDLGSRITLNATNGLADLSRGSIQITRIFSQFAPGPLFTFNLDPELVNLYSATGTNGAYLQTNGPPLNLPTAFSFFPPNQPFIPSHQVLVNPTLSGFPVTRRITNVLSFVDSCGISNFSAFAEVRDFGLGLGRSVTVAFVATNNLPSDTNLSVDVRFINSLFSTNITSTNFITLNPAIAVEYRSTEFDIIEQRFRTNYLTFTDSGFISPMPPPTNVLETFPTPLNYDVIRGRVIGFDFGSPGNTPFTPSLFYNAGFQTNFANYAYSAAAYQLGPTNLQVFNPLSTLIGSTASLGVLPAAADPTNFPSRFEVTAKSLNLDHTRIRAEQAIDIRTQNLISNQFATLDAPFINFQAATTNETLVISNLIPTFVNRVHGELSAYSARWTVTTTNFDVTGTNAIVTPTSFHVLVLGNCLEFSQPTILHRLSLQATNLVIDDVLAVNNSVLLNSDSLTFGTNGGLQLPIRSSWAFTNFPSVSHFTNYGFLNVPGAGAYFGAAPSGYQPPKPPRRRPRKPVFNPLQPYDEFVNHGTIVSASLSVDSSFVDNSGSFFNPAILLTTNGPIILKGDTFSISNALLSSGQNIEIHANNLSLRNSQVSAGRTNVVGNSQIILPGSLIIDATNSFGDFGTSFTNQIVTTGGIRVQTHPFDSGDLLATSVKVLGGVISDSRIVWAGEDRGPFVEGFSGNLALGRLTLDGGVPQGPVGNFFSFHGAGSSNAIYVDFLQLDNFATNFNFALGVAPDFTIYFADSNVSPEKLDQSGGGRIQWVSQFTGPQSSTNLTYPDGSVHTFNAGVVRSKDRDDDNDGIVNFEDCTPIQVPGFDSTQPCGLPDRAKSIALSTQQIGLTIAHASGGQGVVLSWDAPAGSVNTVEFTDSLPDGQWTVFKSFINGPETARVTVKDAVAAPLRVYRVRVDAGKP